MPDTTVAGEGFLFKTDSSVCVELETRLMLRIGLLWMRTGSPTADGLLSTVEFNADTGCVRKLSTRRTIRSELRTYELGTMGGSGGFLAASIIWASGISSFGADLVSPSAWDRLSSPLWMKLKSDKGSGLSWNRWANPGGMGAWLTVWLRLTDTMGWDCWSSRKERLRCWLRIVVKLSGSDLWIESDHHSNPSFQELEAVEMDNQITHIYLQQQVNRSP